MPYEPGLNRCAIRPVPIWAVCVSFWALKSASSCAWIVAVAMPGSKIRTLGPKFGMSGWVGQPPVTPIVYVALATAELVSPLSTPIARIVSDDVTLIGPLNSGELAVGVEPSTVKWMLAPAVDVVIVTIWADGKLPPAGLKVGV